MMLTAFMGNPWTGTTTFSIGPTADLSVFPSDPATPHEVHLAQWSPKQHRQLLHQLRQETQKPTSSKIDVVEVFSPPRFALECAKMGWSCVSADLCTGWDFRKSSDRRAMLNLVSTKKPKLLVLCPPCAWAGGWFHFNKMYMTPEEVRRKMVTTRLFIFLQAVDPRTTK